MASLASIARLIKTVEDERGMSHIEAINFVIGMISFHVDEELVRGMIADEERKAR